MRRPVFHKPVFGIGLVLMLAPAFTACSPQYVDNNGTRYLDANDVSTDMLPAVPYTKSGQYLLNPDEATNTRDNRGMRPQGYGHDVNDDVSVPSVAPGTASTTTTTTTTTVIHQGAPDDSLEPGGAE